MKLPVWTLLSLGGGSINGSTQDKNALNCLCAHSISVLSKEEYTKLLPTVPGAVQFQAVNYVTKFDLGIDLKTLRDMRYLPYNWNILFTILIPKKIVSFREPPTPFTGLDSIELIFGFSIKIIQRAQP